MGGEDRVNPYSTQQSRTSHQPVRPIPWPAMETFERLIDARTPTTMQKIDLAGQHKALWGTRLAYTRSPWV
jgi:hypothetical protein